MKLCRMAVFFASRSLGWVGEAEGRAKGLGWAFRRASIMEVVSQGVVSEEVRSRRHGLSFSVAYMRNNMLPFLSLLSLCRGVT